MPGAPPPSKNARGVAAGRAGRRPGEPGGGRRERGAGEERGCLGLLFKGSAAVFASRVVPASARPPAPWKRQESAAAAAAPWRLPARRSVELQVGRL